MHKTRVRRLCSRGDFNHLTVASEAYPNRNLLWDWNYYVRTWKTSISYSMDVVRRRIEKRLPLELKRGDTITISSDGLFFNVTSVVNDADW